MNTVAEKLTPAIGMPFEGGFYAGNINVDGQPFALIVAPKFDGEHDDIGWNKSSANIEACSYCDGRANTLVMAAAGSALAKWAQGLRIGGLDDWYLPSQDELEICYRALKPTTDENSLYGRSGLNVSAQPPTCPYTETEPAQTSVDAFQKDGTEAFDSTWYWSSTQHAGYDDYAWCQGFSSGGQDDGLKGYQLRARAVRRLAI